MIILLHSLIAVKFGIKVFVVCFKILKSSQSAYTAPFQKMYTFYIPQHFDHNRLRYSLKE